MAANTSPIFSKQPNVGWGILTAGTTIIGATTTFGVTLFCSTAQGSTQGSRIDKLVAVPLGTNIASVLRLYLNNGTLSSGDSSYNIEIAEVTVPATTYSCSAAQARYEYPLDLPIPGGYRIIGGLGQSIAAGIAVTLLGGDY